MSNNPLITVIVPVYNVEKYLSRCVDSIINQTYKNLEIILVDDGSTDSSPAICDNYAKKDNRINVIHKQNNGASSARNAALDIASGDYIGFVDSDDYINRDMYASLLDSIVDSDSDMAICESEYVVNGVSDFTACNVGLDCDEISARDFMREIINVSPTMSVLWNKLYKKSVWSDIRFPDYKVYEDEAIWLLVYKKIAKISVIHKCLYTHFKTDGSIMNNSFGQKNLVLFDVCDERLEYFKSKKDSEFEQLTKYSMFKLIKFNYIHLPKSNKTMRTALLNILRDYRKKYLSISFLKSIQSKKAAFNICMFACFPHIYYDIFLLKYKL